MAEPPAAVTMADMDEAKIQQAADTCLRLVAGGEGVFRRVADFISGLRTDPTWSAEETIEVQTRVIRELMTRITGE